MAFVKDARWRFALSATAACLTLSTHVQLVNDCQSLARTASQAIRCGTIPRLRKLAICDEFHIHTKLATTSEALLAHDKAFSLPCV